MNAIVKEMPGRLLLTGATGFLGGAILAELIGQARWSSVLLLVRGADAADGRRRIVETLRKWDVAPEFCARVSTKQVLLGDLCGVSKFADDQRLRGVTDVINCAALAGFGRPPALWPTNVDGTLAFARLLGDVARLRRFVHVGTAMSCGLPAPNVVDENYVPPTDAEHLVPYTQSKVECEERLRAELAGLPLVVARPSIIVGDTRLGCRPSPSIFWVFRMARALGRFTCSLDDHVDVVPADYCARAVLHLLDAPALAHDMYHVSAGPKRSSTFGEIEQAIAEGLGVPPTRNYEQVDYSTIAASQDRFQDLFGPCVESFMLRAIQLYGQYAALDMTFENQRLLAEGMPPPPRFAEYAGLCARTGCDESIAEQMQYDFKGISARAARAVAAMTNRAAVA